MAIPSYLALDPHADDPAARTRHRKVYALTSKRKRMVVGVGALHWHDGTQWVDIDLTPVVTAGRVRTTSTPYTVDVDPATASLTYTNRMGGTLTMTLEAVGGLPPVPKLVSPRANAVVTVELAPDVLMDVRFYPEGVDLFRRLLTPSAAHVFTWRVTESVVNTPSSNILATTGRDNLNGVGRKLLEVVCVASNEVVTATHRSYTVTETITGRVREVDPITHARSWSTDIRYPLQVDPTVNETIADSTDDGFEKAATWYSNNDYLYCSVTQNPAWRFQTVDVPQGATINSATLGWNQMTASTDTGTLYGEDVDDAASWANFSANGPSGMTKTTATATFSITTSTGAKTLDVTSIVQEIVSRAGWASGNDLRLGATGFADADGSNKIEALDFVGGTAQATLDIDYTAGGGGPTVTWVGYIG